MSVQTALQFIRLAREDAAIRGRIQALGPAGDLEALVGVGAEIALEFTAEELQSAYKHDWRMRWLHYSSKHQFQEASRTLGIPGVS